MKFAMLALFLIGGAGATLALTRTPAPPYRPRQVNQVPTGKHVTLEVEANGPRKRRILVAAEVCLREGMLEQLLTRKSTKEHEAILSTEADARDIHLALLAAGATPGSPVQYDPIYNAAHGQTIRVSLEWQEKGKARRTEAQRWIRNVKTKKPMAHDWVFTGSQFVPDPMKPGHQAYLANVGDVICVANFENALLDLPVRSPKDQADLCFEAFTANIPPVGTRVTLILEPVAARAR